MSVPFVRVPFDRRHVSLFTEQGSQLVIARCRLSGCEWRMHFSTYNYDVVAETIEEHPCRGEPPRCSSCDHEASMHRPEGCLYTVKVGGIGRDLVCVCVVSSLPPEQAS